MFATLEFVMVSCLFLDLAWSKGAAVLAWLKSKETSVVADVKKL